MELLFILLVLIISLSKVYMRVCRMLPTSSPVVILNTVLVLVNATAVLDDDRKSATWRAKRC
jgi:hypothetical protein